MRGRSKPRFITLDIPGSLHGSIRYDLDEAGRGTWYDLLLTAGECDMGGWICDNDHRAWPHDVLAKKLNCDLKNLERCLQQCKQEGRITEDEHGIHIVHWDYYQPEYLQAKRRKERYEAKKKPKTPSELDAITRKYAETHPDAARDALSAGHRDVIIDGRTGEVLRDQDAQPQVTRTLPPWLVAGDNHHEAAP